MMELDVIPGPDTLIDYVLPKLNLSTPEIVLQSLFNAGVSYSKTIVPLFQILLRKEMISEIKHLSK